MLKTPKVVVYSLAPGEVVEWTAYGIRPIAGRYDHLPVFVAIVVGFVIHQTTGILNDALMVELGAGAWCLVGLWRENKKLGSQEESRLGSH